VLIASLGGVQNQLKGHTQGNLNMKNDRSVLSPHLLPFAHLLAIRAP